MSDDLSRVRSSNITTGVSSTTCFRQTHKDICCICLTKLFKMFLDLI